MLINVEIGYQQINLVSLFMKLNNKISFIIIILIKRRSFRFLSFFRLFQKAPILQNISKGVKAFFKWKKISIGFYSIKTLIFENWFFVFFSFFESKISFCYFSSLSLSLLEETANSSRVRSSLHETTPLSKSTRFNARIEVLG